MVDASTTFDFDIFVNECQSKDKDVQFNSWQTLHKPLDSATSHQETESIVEMLLTNKIMRYLLEALTSDASDNINYANKTLSTALLCLLDMSKSDNDDQMNQIIQHKELIPKLIQLLMSHDKDIANDALWTIAKPFT